MSTRANGLLANGDSIAVTGQAEQTALTFSVTTQNRSQTTNSSTGTAAATKPQTSESAGLLANQNQDTATQALSASTPKTQQASSLAVTPTPGPLAVAGATKPADPNCDTSQSKLFCIYTVAEGDTLSTIATKFNIQGNEDVTAAEMLAMSNKPDVIDEDDLSIGQKLRIPVESGIIHTVLSAQTLSELATQYDVKTDQITNVAGNGIGDLNALRVGQDVLIPSPRQFVMPAPPPTPTPTAKPINAAAPSSGSSSGATEAAAPVRRTGAVSGAGLIWPVGGPISSYFGPSHPLGIDIDLFAAPNAPIGAAAAGTVTFAGGNACCSYGYYVVVDHGGGLQTLYAHFSKINVVVGEKVSQGEILGNGGRTGYATGNHLHFEVHVNGATVNPTNYLP